MARIETITGQYEFCHGKLPRGRGSWAIRVVFYANNVKCWMDYFKYGTLTEARKSALRSFSFDQPDYTADHVVILP